MILRKVLYGTPQARAKELSLCWSRCSCKKPMMSSSSFMATDYGQIRTECQAIAARLWAVSGHFPTSGIPAYAVGMRKKSPISDLEVDRRAAAIDEGRQVLLDNLRRLWDRWEILPDASLREAEKRSGLSRQTL